MKMLYQRLLAPHKIEYIEIDSNFAIAGFSPNVLNYADCPKAVKLGEDARLGFPELVGSEQCLHDALGGRQTHFEIEGIVRPHAGSHPIYLNLHILAGEVETEEAQTLIVCFENVTEKMLIQQKMRQHANETELLARSLAASQAYIHKIITSMADALLVTTLEGSIKTLNPAALDLLECTEEELMYQPIAKIIPPEDLATIQRDRGTTEIAYQTPSGQLKYLAFSRSTMQADVEDWRSIIYIGRDITELKQAKLALQQANEELTRHNQELQQQSSLDPLTGLHNRRHLENFLDEAIRTAQIQNDGLSIAMLDVDHFKHFNDTFGHAAGDAILQEISRSLQQSIRTYDLACRYGGEEFLLVLQRITPEIAKMRIEQMRHHIKKLQVHYGEKLLGSITLSCGIAHFPDNGSTAEELILAADRALYAAKEGGRDRAIVAS
ncbi:diguanylate cyclase [Lusitaniella coriacea]|uniref:diguanylate cyclase n=1 Tax=Lusitaniella coriacea TaxID=1983105 RepID=UPI003CEDF99B